MKKRILFSILTLLLCTYLQYGQKETILYSYINTSGTPCTHELYVNANKLLILNKKKYAEKLEAKIRENTLNKIKLSYEDYYSTEFYVTVYTNRLFYFFHKSFFFTFTTFSSNGYTSTPL